MNIGDEVTINGVVAGMSRIITRCEVEGEEVIVRLNCGTEIHVKEQEISTTRPKIEIPNKAEEGGEMTEEEAIEILENTTFIAPLMVDVDTALNMAISALQKQKDNVGK